MTDKNAKAEKAPKAKPKNQYAELQDEYFDRAHKSLDPDYNDTMLHVEHLLGDVRGPVTKCLKSITDTLVLLDEYDDMMEHVKCAMCNTVGVASEGPEAVMGTASEAEDWLDKMSQKLHEAVGHNSVVIKNVAELRRALHEQIGSQDEMRRRVFQHFRLVHRFAKGHGPKDEWCDKQAKLRKKGKANGNA